MQVHISPRPHTVNNTKMSVQERFDISIFSTFCQLLFFGMGLIPLHHQSRCEKFHQHFNLDALGQCRISPKSQSRLYPLCAQIVQPACCIITVHISQVSRPLMAYASYGSAIVTHTKAHALMSEFLRYVLFLRVVSSHT